MMSAQHQMGSGQKMKEPNIYSNLMPPAVQQELQPGNYTMQNFVKEDRTQMCNLDRFIEATMPANFCSSQNSLAELIEAYHKVSIKGI